MEAHAPVLEYLSFSVNDENGNNNGRIDPGETAEIQISISNSGSSGAFNVITGLSCQAGYTSVLTPAQSSGNIGPGESSEVIFNVTADPYTPGGYNETFSVDIAADHNRSGSGQFTCVIGQYSALVLDLDPGTNSGPAILGAFGNLDLIANYSNTIPEDLSIFKSIFLCLGIYYSSHELTEAEAQVLKEYLENGGKIYMEGRLTWHEDLQTSLHPMFNITTEAVNWFEYDKIYGVPGTMTEGMEFGYEMTQPYNNHFLHATAPAFEIMNALADSQALMVAYDEGEYKTIGSNLEFGGLSDNDYPSTKKQLLTQILEFFGDIMTGTDNKIEPEDAMTVDVYPNPFFKEVNFSFTLDAPSRINLEIFDPSGKLVYHLADEIMDSGNHRLTWAPGKNGEQVTGSLYFYRFFSGKEIINGKLMLFN